MDSGSRASKFVNSKFSLTARDPDIKLIEFGDTAIKFKFIYNSKRGSSNGDEKKLPCEYEKIHTELEEAILKVENMKEMEPFKTDHLIIYPHEEKWLTCDKVGIKGHDGKLLKASSRSLVLLCEDLRTKRHLLQFHPASFLSSVSPSLEDSSRPTEVLAQEMEEPVPSTSSGRTRQIKHKASTPLHTSPSKKRRTAPQVSKGLPFLLNKNLNKGDSVNVQKASFKEFLRLTKLMTPMKRVQSDAAAFSESTEEGQSVGQRATEEMDFRDGERAVGETSEEYELGNFRLRDREEVVADSQDGRSETTEEYVLETFRQRKEELFVDSQDSGKTLSETTQEYELETFRLGEKMVRDLQDSEKAFSEATDEYELETFGQSVGNGKRGNEMVVADSSRDDNDRSNRNRGEREFEASMGKVVAETQESELETDMEERVMETQLTEEHEFENYGEEEELVLENEEKESVEVKGVGRKGGVANAGKEPDKGAENHDIFAARPALWGGSENWDSEQDKIAYREMVRELDEEGGDFPNSEPSGRENSQENGQAVSSTQVEMASQLLLKNLGLISKATLGPEQRRADSPKGPGKRLRKMKHLGDDDDDELFGNRQNETDSLVDQEDELFKIQQEIVSVMDIEDELFIKQPEINSLAEREEAADSIEQPQRGKGHREKVGPEADQIADEDEDEDEDESQEMVFGKPSSKANHIRQKTAQIQAGRETALSKPQQSKPTKDPPQLKGASGGRSKGKDHSDGPSKGKASPGKNKKDNFMSARQKLIEITANETFALFSKRYL